MANQLTPRGKRRGANSCLSLGGRNIAWCQIRKCCDTWQRERRGWARLALVGLAGQHLERFHHYQPAHDGIGRGNGVDDVPGHALRIHSRLFYSSSASIPTRPRAMGRNSRVKQLVSLTTAHTAISQKPTPFVQPLVWPHAFPTRAMRTCTNGWCGETAASILAPA